MKTDISGNVKRKLTPTSSSVGFNSKVDSPLTDKKKEFGGLLLNLNNKVSSLKSKSPSTVITPTTSSTDKKDIIGSKTSTSVSTLAQDKKEMILSKTSDKKFTKHTSKEIITNKTQSSFKTTLRK